MTQNNTIPQFNVWCNGEFVTDDGFNELLINSKNEVFMYHEYVNDNGCIYRDETAQPYKLENPTICRFTGLFDKSNTPIYENDIVKLRTFGELRNDQSYIHKVEYILSDFGKEMNLSPFFHSYKECEFLGNILENPELLGKSNE